MNIKNINISKKITHLLFLIFFLIGIFTFKDYGISTDEEFQRSSGLYWLNYVLNFTPFSELASEVSIKFSQSKTFTVPDVEVYKYYGVIFDLPSALLETLFKINDPKDYFYLKHFLNFTLFFIAAILFYKLLFNRFSNQTVALTGTLFFVLSPRIYGSSFYNPKDMIFLSLLTMAFYFCFKLFDKMSYKNFLIFGLFCALGTSQRIWGIFLPLSFIGFYFLSILSKKEGLNYFSGIVFFCISFFLFLIVFWPYLWSNPVVNFAEAFRYFSHNFAVDIKMLFNGEYININFLPYSYIITWILITTPTLYIVLFLIGYFQIFKRFFLKFINIKNNQDYYDLWRSVNEKKDLFILFILTCILFYLIAFNASIFTGWRHLYFINIFIIYIASHAFYRINFILKSNFKKKILLLFTSFYLIFIGYKMFIYHPYQNIYFNTLFNKMTKSIHKKFEIDYWGLSGKKFLENVLLLEKDKEQIYVASASFISLERRKLLLDPKKRKKIKVVGQEYQKADYIYSNFTSEVDKKYNDKYKIPSNFKKINTFVLDNVVVYEVYKKNN